MGISPETLLRLLLDPTAPLPPSFPAGALGAFLLFLLPIGGGIPLGVILADRAGVPVPAIVGMYFVSDLAAAVTNEPVLALVRWIGRRAAFLRRMGERLSSLTAATGLQAEGARGPVGLVLLSFAISPLTARAAASAAGHGPISGWALAIAGDMAYFVVLLATTLWLTALVGSRAAIGVVLLLSWVLLPVAVAVFRRRGRKAPAPAPASDPTPLPTAAAPVLTPSLPVRARRQAPRPSHRRAARRRAR